MNYHLLIDEERTIDLVVHVCAKRCLLFIPEHENTDISTVYKRAKDELIAYKQTYSDMEKIHSKRSASPCTTQTTHCH